MLRDVARLYPSNQNPFFAGFGNRESDVIAYRAAGVPVHRIFIISPDGNAVMYNRTFIKTYKDLDKIG